MSKDARATPKKWVFFDLGWTLADETRSDEVFFQNLHRLLNSYGASFTRARYNSCIRDRITSRAATGHGHLAETLFDSYAKRGSKKEFMAKLLPESWARNDVGLWVLNKDVMPTLRQVNVKHSCGMIANQAVFARPFIENRRKFRSYFKVIILSAEVGVAKPDPRIFQTALEEAGSEPRESVYVGDRVDYDIAPAKRLGMTTVRVRRPKSVFSSIEPTQLEERADYEIDDLRILPRILSRIEPELRPVEHTRS